MGDPDRLTAAGDGAARRSTGFATAAALCSLAVLSALVTLAAWAAVPALVGSSTPRVVTSGSMQPSIRVGDVVVTAPVPAHGPMVAPPSIITFEQADGRDVTHRVVAAEDGRYVTRGDANANVDSDRVRPADVLGIAEVVVPFVGLPRVWLDEGRFALLVVLVVALLVLCWTVARGLGGRDPGEPGTQMSGRTPRRGHRRAVGAPVALSLAGLLVLVAPAASVFSASTSNTGSSFTTATLAAPTLRAPTFTVGCIMTLSWDAAPAPVNAYEYRTATGSPPTGSWTTTTATSVVTLNLGTAFSGTVHYQVRSKIDGTNWVSATSSGSRTVGLLCAL